jgi:hypothetical protein
MYKSRKSRKEHDQAIRKSSIQSIGFDPLRLHGIATIAAVDRDRSFGFEGKNGVGSVVSRSLPDYVLAGVIPVESFVE